MLDRPWVRLVLGALAAALLGAMAARVAVSATAGAGAGGGSATSASGSSRGGSGGSYAGDSSGGGGGSSGGDAADGAASGGGATATLAGGSGKVTVHVTGDVRRPGVYTLAEGSRVDDAVRRAGGATGDGDRQALNLAAPVRDGQQVRVPARVVPVAAGAGSASGGGAAGSAGTDGTTAGAGGPPVDLNTASVEELQTLDGVGPATAEKIVKLREERGGLAGVDDLDEVPGIGAKKLEALRAQLGG